MSQNARESLSALMDSEGDDLELRRVLHSLEEEPDAAEAWRRYHLMRSLLRRERDIDVSTDLTAGILARLEDEPAPAMEKVAATAPRTIPFARSAGIAAAVTLMVITGVQFYQGSGFSGTQPEVADSREGVAPAADRQDGAMPAFSGQAAQVGFPRLSSPTDGRGASSLVSVGAQSGPLFMAPSPRHSPRSDQAQAQLLQTYLDRHAEGAASRGGDTWLPLLRASGGESLGQR